jgi:hypothetical protein
MMAAKDSLAGKTAGSRACVKIRPAADMRATLHSTTSNVQRAFPAMKKALKLIGLIAIIFLAYKAAHVYATVKWSIYVVDCAEKLELCSLGKQRASVSQITGVVDNLYSCVAKRQPFVESLLVPLPKSHAAISSAPLDYKYAEAFCLPR